MLGTCHPRATHSASVRSAQVEENTIDDDEPALDELARLYELERVARGVAEAARARAEFLARASAMFTASLEYEDTLAAVASAAVPTIADWCMVDLVEGEHVKPVAVAHADPAKVALAKTLQQRYPPSREQQAGATSVIRTGTPQFYTEISDAVLAAKARDAEHLRIAKELGVRSAMLVPIKTHDATIGAITFVLAGSSRRYTEEDLVYERVRQRCCWDHRGSARRCSGFSSWTRGRERMNPPSISASASLRRKSSVKESPSVSISARV